MDTGRPQPESGPAATDDELAVLLKAVAAQAEGAFAVLYERLWHSVHGVVRQVLSDLGTAEDVTQEVLLEIWPKAASFDPAQGSASAWTLMTARRRAADRRRADTTISRTYRPHGSGPRPDTLS